jgi:hypothetical protein
MLLGVQQGKRIQIESVTLGLGQHRASAQRRKPEPASGEKSESMERPRTAWMHVPRDRPISR